MQPYSGFAEAVDSVCYDEVPVSSTCTQMQQSWHKPRPTEIQAAPVMNVLFSKAKQSEIKKNQLPAVCTKLVISLYKSTTSSNNSA